MHDPMVVAFEIRRPWPQRSVSGSSGSRWQVRYNHVHFEDRDAPGICGGCGHSMTDTRQQFPWWRRSSYSSFWTLAGRRYYWPSMVTVWHVEPDGRDSGEVCKHSTRWQEPDGTWRSKSNRAWRWHVWHWRVQVALAGKVKRFLFERCIECGRRFPWGYAPISHSWDGPRARWFRISRVAYHHECSSLVSLRRAREGDERLIRHLFAAYRLGADLAEPEALGKLTDPRNRSLEFLDARRLTLLLGYERDDNYDLVPVAASSSAHPIEETGNG
jgi:hypothetical protein